MAQFFEIHPDNPQRRLIQQAVTIIDRGGLVIYPTDSSYALGCPYRQGPPFHAGLQRPV
jgi:tRNA A37 threonylcarbamoyladenosine synthetase subunit TsaC/SUA5/YrdC